jgi:L-alanine-DL-glutamate epimerase-like enolase superfamily enzyme
VPVHALLGGMGRPRVRAYASSINWFDDAAATAEIESALDAGFTTIKLKIAPSPDEAIARARLARRVAGDDVRLAADANWAFDVHEAIVVGSALADLGFAFFEEPIQPHDREGYRKLSRHLPIRLAAGESDFCATQTLEYLEDRSVALVQPDVARSGGISETWRIAELAAVFGAGYAPHVGWSGAICECASLHLAAAAEAFVLFEKMVFDNPLRQRLCHGPAVVLAGGEVAVPQGPGLGIELDRDVLAAMLVR